MLQATFRIALLLMTLGRPLTSLKSCASKRSMSSFFQRPTATIGLPIYTRMLLANTQVRVSLMSRSTLRSFHFRWPRLRLMLATHFSLCAYWSMCTGTLRYLTCVAQGMPAMSGMFSSVRTCDFVLLSLKFHIPFREYQ